MGDEIHIAGGLYRPDQDALDLGGHDLVGFEHTENDRDETFMLPGAVIIKGGYAGLADPLNPDQRDINYFVSMLSGDVGTLDDLNPGTTGDLTDNVYRVVTCTAVTGNEFTILDGCVIELAYDDFPGAGGGVWCYDSAPTIRNCMITNNHTPGTSGLGHGGGLYFDGTQPVAAQVINCTIIGNTAGAGGGVAFKNANPNFTSCWFQENSATYFGGAAALFVGDATFTSCTFYRNSVNAVTPNLEGGGAVYCGAIGSAPEFRNCNFISNTARNSPGGGASIYHNSTAFIRCYFGWNVSIATSLPLRLGPPMSDFVPGGRGAGLYIDQGGFIVNSTFAGNSVQSPGLNLEDPEDDAIEGRGAGIYLRKYMTECVNNQFYWNGATRGGGLYAENETNTDPSDPYAAIFHAYNCTFADNGAADVGGGADALGLGQGDQVFSNCIFWHNTGASLDPIENNLNATAALGPAEHCCIEDAAVGGTIPYDGSANGNIDADPLFVNEYALDAPLLMLLSNSPCLDSGNTPPVPTDSFNVNAPDDANTAEKTPDLRLRRRVFDVPSAPNTGEADDCGYVDMGAFEYIINGDMNEDGGVDGRDIQPFVDCFKTGSVTGVCIQADVVPDGVSTFDDVTCFIHILLGEPSCLVECPEPFGGEGGGESQSMIGGGESEGMAAGGSGGSEAPEEEVEDPAFTARWNAFVEWLDAHWIDAYPDMTEEEWNDMTTAMMIEMVYEGVAP